MPSRIADKLLDAIETNDMATLRDICSGDFVVWHSFDQVDRPLDQVIEDLQTLHRAVPGAHYGEREFFDVPDGVIGTYVNTGVTITGKPIALYVALRLYVRDGLITRINEYVESTQCAPILEAATAAASQ